MNEDELYEHINDLRNKIYNLQDKLDWLMKFLQKSHVTVEEYKKIVEKVEKNDR